MNVSVVGLGYVGLITAGCLARDGFNVWGVDLDEERVEAVQKAKAPIVEAGLEALLKSGQAAGRLRATSRLPEAVAHTEVSVICVGTPFFPDKGYDLSALFSACHTIAKAVAEKGAPHVVIIRSTVYPGTTAKCAKLFEEQAPGATIFLLSLIHI